jgi:lipopolysaccharide transport system ATP-binding protein
MRCVLKVNNLSKVYYSHNNEIRRIISWFFPIKKTEQGIKVLDKISFSVSTGEVVGVVGSNGAGKSSLLKIITGTLSQTSGNFTVNGTISSILELGMGFHPELSGRQNAINTAKLLGHQSKNNTEYIEEIENFADIGEYFDLPVRSYSSGMQIRVAFAVAIAFRPDLLIIDEALSVGDAYFQKKCFDKIKDFQAKGTAILFVSHDKATVQNICNKAILLENGILTKEGDPEEVLNYYNAIISKQSDSIVKIRELEGGNFSTTSGSGEVKITHVSLSDKNRTKKNIFNVGSEVILKTKVKVENMVDSLVLGYSIKDRFGQVIYGTNTWHTNQVINAPKSGSSYSFSISFLANLGEGNYSVSLALHDKDNHLSKSYYWIDNAVMFSIVNSNKIKFDGCNWIEQDIEVKKYE